jgi:hypothetical protein
MGRLDQQNKVKCIVTIKNNWMTQISIYDWGILSLHKENEKLAKANLTGKQKVLNYNASSPLKSHLPCMAAKIQ